MVNKQGKESCIKVVSIQLHVFEERFTKKIYPTNSEKSVKKDRLKKSSMF